MIVKDGIAYADGRPPLLKVCGVQPLPGHRLWLRFSTGEARLFDFAPLLRYQSFSPLRDETLFAQVCLDYGCPTWLDGAVDLSPEKLYRESRPATPEERGPGYGKSRAGTTMNCSSPA